MTRNRKPADDLVAFLLAIASMVFLVAAAGADPSGSSSAAEPAKADEQTVVDVDRSIRFFLADSPCWGLAADGEARRTMAEKLATAAIANDVPPILLALIAKRESSFDKDAIGSSHGEIGILQVHGLAAKGCDLDTVEGQLDCGASWLRKAYETCGNWEKAIVAYASGRCNAEKGGKLYKASHSRFVQWRKAETAVSSCGKGTGEHWVCQPRKGKCSAARVID